MLRKSIALIQPPYYRLFDDTYSYNEYPLSLGYLAGTIKTNTDWDVIAYNTDFSNSNPIGNDHVTFSYRSKEGHKNFVNNLSNSLASIWKEIKDTIVELNPTVVGISTMTQNFKSACMIAKIIKEINKDIVVIVGGPHPSMVEIEVLECPYIDIGVIGEGDITLLEVLSALTGNRELNSVEGIVFRENGEQIANTRRALIQDLDVLCFPHEFAPSVLKDFELYPKSAFGNILGSRGCPYSCTFCGSRKIWGQKVRSRSPDNIINEIKGLQVRGINSLRFADDTFGLNKAWTKDVCEGLSSKCRGLKWKCEVNVNLINDVFLQQVKKAGCHMIELGVESGDNKILKDIRKNITIEQALTASSLVNKYNIELQAYIIVGFPNETEESLQKTRDAIHRIDGYIWLSVFNPFPGTELYKSCIEMGLIDKTYDLTLHNYQNLDSFCRYISKQRFSDIVSEIMIEVDNKNSKNHISRIFSFNTIWRIRELGVVNAARKGMRIAQKLLVN